MSPTPSAISRKNQKISSPVVQGGQIKDNFYQLSPCLKRNHYPYLSQPLKHMPRMCNSPMF